MVEQFSAKLVDRLISEKLINAEKRDYYCYGLITTVEKTITYSSIFLLAVLFHSLIPTILYLLFFISLRKYTGGFHAPSYLACYIGTLGIYSICMFGLLPLLLEYNWVLLGCVLLSYIIIWRLAPINHPNINWDTAEFSAAKAKVRRILNIEMLLWVLLYLIEHHIYYQAASGLGIMTCAMLLLTAKLLKQEVNRNEKRNA